MRQVAAVLVFWVLQLTGVELDAAAILEQVASLLVAWAVGR